MIESILGFILLCLALLICQVLAIPFAFALYMVIVIGVAILLAFATTVTALCCRSADKIRGV